jgi:hypothetical protein
MDFHPEVKRGRDFWVFGHQVNDIHLMNGSFVYWQMTERVLSFQLVENVRQAAGQDITGYDGRMKFKI